MAKQNKTIETKDSVTEFIAKIKDEQKRKDFSALTKLISKHAGFKPKMWGNAIVGFGSYHYRYESGREGEMCLVGFASRKGDISLYGLSSAPNHAELLAKLGKHKTGKGCLYIRQLSDVALKVLTKLVTQAVKATQKLHPKK